MFKAFFISRSHIKEIGVVLKLSLVEHYNWSYLTLFFVDLNELSPIWEVALELSTISVHYTILFQFLRRMERSTVSKAFDRSMNTPSVYLVFSKDSVIWSTNCSTAWSVEWLFWKSNCLEYKILFSIKYFYKRLCIICTWVFWKSMWAQILVCSYLCHYCPHPYKWEWLVLPLSSLEKHSFQLRD